MRDHRDPAGLGAAFDGAVTAHLASETARTRPELAPWHTDVWDWQMRGACREMDSALFFHPENERGPARAAREAHAKQICRSCPVLQQCRAHSLAAHEPYGVWGGMSESERDEIIRARDRILRVGQAAAGRQPSGVSARALARSPGVS